MLALFCIRVLNSMYWLHPGCLFCNSLPRCVCVYNVFPVYFIDIFRILMQWISRIIHYNCQSSYYVNEISSLRHRIVMMPVVCVLSSSILRAGYSLLVFFVRHYPPSQRSLILGQTYNTLIIFNNNVILFINLLYRHVWENAIGLFQWNTLLWVFCKYQFFLFPMRPYCENG